MNKKIKTEAVDSLFDAILTLKDRNECYAFFEDLCTVNEIKSIPMAQGALIMQVTDRKAMVEKYDANSTPHARSVTRCLAMYLHWESSVQAPVRSAPCPPPRDCAPDSPCISGRPGCVLRSSAAIAFGVSSMTLSFGV